MSYLVEAKALLDELITYRRYLHQHPELGYELPNTVAFVLEKLKAFGYEAPQVIANSGVMVTVGRPGKVVLLRADMDALPIKEQSGEPFSSVNDYMHACGHDYHTTMLLGVAKLLKAHEDQLQGTVKLLFQPAEELLTGGQVMVDAGVLENPQVDVACAGHVAPNIARGIYTHKGVLMASANNFKIEIKGCGAHGAQPSAGIDPVNIGSHIVLRAQTIIARELPVDEEVVITMGKFIADGAVNIIPEKAVIEGTLRTFSSKSQAYAKKRLVEIVEETARTFRGEAQLTYSCDVPVLATDPEVIECFNQAVTKAMGDEINLCEAPVLSGSEDFAHITARVPSAHFWLGVPYPDTAVHYALHHPKVKFDEQQIPYGVAAYCEFASQWLEQHA